LSQTAEQHAFDDYTSRGNFRGSLVESVFNVFVSYRRETARHVRMSI